MWRFLSLLLLTGSAQAFDEKLALQDSQAAIGRQIGKGFGAEAGTLYEIAVKSNLLILLYEPGNDQGIADVIQSRCTEVGLPNNLWFDVVSTVRGSASKEDVKAAVFKMHDDIAAYLGAHGQEVVAHA